MEQMVIIKDLLNWIDRNLDSIDNRLSLDLVAEKAGYSKWHLQRMFKDITGHAIGAYIRARRLSKSAAALRLTSRPILDIALQYRFDSQQTFTRAFKKQFKVTPALYRRAEDWNAGGMRPPIRLDNCAPLAHQFVTLPPLELVGVTQSYYTCSLEQIAEYRYTMRLQFWQQFLKNTSPLPSVFYGLHEAHPSPDREDEQEMFYTTALTKQDADKYLHGFNGANNITLAGGDYVQFTYDGPRENLQNFVMTLYGTCMPELNLTRRKSQDIEIFRPKSEIYNPEERQKKIHCEYLIPIRREQPA